MSILRCLCSTSFGSGTDVNRIGCDYISGRSLYFCLRYLTCVRIRGIPYHRQYQTGISTLQFKICSRSLFPDFISPTDSKTHIFLHRISLHGQAGFCFQRTIFKLHRIIGSISTQPGIGTAHIDHRGNRMPISPRHTVITNIIQCRIIRFG